MYSQVAILESHCTRDEGSKFGADGKNAHSSENTRRIVRFRVGPKNSASCFTPLAHMANRGSVHRRDVQRGCSAASAPAPPTHDDDDDDADSDDQWEDGGVEDWDEPENAPTRCLFTDQEFASPAECLAHAASSHALDLHLLIGRLKLDLYDKMKLVNFLRTSLRTPGADVAAVVAAVVACQPGAPELWPWSDDTNLQPVLADDPLLYSLSMDDEEADEAEEQACKCTSPSICTCTCTCTWTCPCTCRGVGGRARVLALT